MYRFYFQDFTKNHGSQTASQLFGQAGFGFPAQIVYPFIEPAFGLPVLLIRIVRIAVHEQTADLEHDGLDKRRRVKFPRI